MPSRCGAGGEAGSWPLASVPILPLILVTFVTALKRAHQRVLMTMAAGT
ncbi:hypothetical protein [Streptomyces sp. NPDC060002]